ncbi:RloB family protein [Muricauda sp. SCSIO 64092]|uniref:RloB family protein n=1 Tax=Allomuricauda sp. SCSIO 64092 TaxID=2908842 RepID=UPI001FF4E319|nr:RloB family protein [Muricauda sp. SCSIO 64092]UOY06574.1 RloB family protein [Muricauda sp. SCSIO 64092]
MSGRKKRKINLKRRIFVVGEGITEQYYFSHLKAIRNYSCAIKPRFFCKTSITQIEKVVEKLLMGDILVICVFDADVSSRNPTENERLKSFKQRYKRNKCVIICDSLPSIELWFLLHFVQTSRHFQSSKSVERELRKHIKNYAKTKRYLENPDWVRALSVNQDKAITNAKLLENLEGESYSNLYKAIDMLEDS